LDRRVLPTFASFEVSFVVVVIFFVEAAR